MLIQSNEPKHYSEIRKHWTRAANPYSKDPTEGVLRVTEAIANRMPDLGLPRMPSNARTAFKDVLRYERPPGNGSVSDILIFAQARGYCAHPCDWVPSSEGDNQFPEFYEPWAAWLAENNYTPFYGGVRLTAENFDRWKPNPRASAFQNLRRKDRAAADHFFLTVCANKPAAIRRKLAAEIGKNAMFAGPYPQDVPTLRQLLSDRDEKIRAHAEKKLREMKGFETKEDHAKVLAKHFKISGKGLFSGLFRSADHPKVIVAPKFLQDSEMRHCFSTDLDALVCVLGITAKDFLNNVDMEHFKGKLFSLCHSTKDEDARKILARRAVESGAECYAGLFRDAEPELWQRALEINLDSEYPFLAFRFLESKVGTLDITKVRKMRGYSGVIPSILRELEAGQLPVNKQYDPLRYTALVASQDAAAELVEEALAAGMAEDNPRLTMLKFNLML